MMRSTIALLLLIPFTAYAEVKIVGPSNVNPHKLVKLSADGADPKAGLVWRVHPRLEDRASSPKGKLEFVAPPGTYEVELLAIKLSSNGETLVEEARHTVVIGEPGPKPPEPGPKPPEPPTPPEPSDPLFKWLKMAYTNDTSPEKASQLSDLTAGYREAMKLANDATITTVGALNGRIHQGMVRLLAVSDLRNLRDVIGGENKTVLDAPGDTVITSDYRKKAAAHFERIALLLEAIK